MKIKRQRFGVMITQLTLLALLVTSLSAGTKPLFSQGEILDEESLEVKVLQDWHTDSTSKKTRQKLVEIKVAEWWPGQDYRIPVRFIVPLARKAKGIHLTSQHQYRSLDHDAELNKTQLALIDGGIGLVYTVVQRLPAAVPGGRKLEREMFKQLIRTQNPRYIATWIWPMTLMRALTAAYAEKDHFEPGKVAGSGSSKNGMSPAIALIHDTRFTATFSNVSPIYLSPLRELDQATMDEVRVANDSFFEGVEGNRIDSCERAADWYERRAWGFSQLSMHKRALEAGWSWEEIRTLAQENAGRMLISEHWDQLMARDVDVFFQPGTHDYVAFDVLWGARHHPHIPVYYKPNGGHGQKLHHASPQSLVEIHEGKEEYFGEENLNAFLLNHFFGGEALLEVPKSGYKLADASLHVSVVFDSGPQPDTGRIWWMYDRAPAGSGSFLCDRIPDDQWMDMKLDQSSGAWTATIPLRSDASRIDFFSTHGQRVYGHPFHISSPYTRVELAKSAEREARKKILFFAGPCLHPKGTHEAAAGARLLKYIADNAEGLQGTESVILDQWPENDQVLDEVATIVFIGDMFPPDRLKEPAVVKASLGRLMNLGVGIVCLHFATGLRSEHVAEDGYHPLLDWLGGYYANKCPHHSSVAKICKATIVPEDVRHPVLRGWDSFTFDDEPYWNIYFGEENRTTPLASSMMPPENPRKETVAWAFTREDGGRGVGIVFPHYYRNWLNDDLRTLILNAVGWTAQLEIPYEGIRSPVPDLASFEPGAVSPEPPAQQR